MPQQRLELTRDTPFAFLGVSEYLKHYLPSELAASPGIPESNLEWVSVLQDLDAQYNIQMLLNWDNAPLGDRDSIRVTITSPDLCPLVHVPIVMAFASAEE